MKTISVLLLSLLLFACSSDDDVATKPTQTVGELSIKGFDDEFILNTYESYVRTNQDMDELIIYLRSQSTKNDINLSFRTPITSGKDVTNDLYGINIAGVGSDINLESGKIIVKTVNQESATIQFNNVTIKAVKKTQLSPGNIKTDTKTITINGTMQFPNR